MALTLKPGECLEQIGTTAMRTANGEFLPSVPMYVIVSSNEVNSKTGMTQAEEHLIEDVSKVFADNFKKYVEGTKKLRKEEAK